MKKDLFKIFTLSISLVIMACSSDDNNNTPTLFEEVVAVANQSSGSVSFIDAETNQTISTLEIPGSQPMYVVYVPKTDKVYVGDRAQNQVHVINPNTKVVENSIEVGQGVFHMWADGQGNQLWVNNDVDNTISVINLNTNTVIETIELNVKPHDVFLTESGDAAYVSILIGNTTVADSVYAFSTATFQKTASKLVGDDPHLYHIPSSNQLYVANQSGELLVLNGNDLSELNSLPLAGAHGIFPSADNQQFFITDLPGSQLYSVNTADLTLNGPALSTTVAIPHNIVVNQSGNKAFVTHSGSTANQVTVYDISNGNLTLNQTLTTENNPFGLAYYRRGL